MAPDFTFELSEVVAARRRAALSSKLIGTEISVRYSTAFAEAFKNDSAITVGWIPLLSIFSAAPNRLPAKTTTEVVPSPASTSCAADRSTSYRKCAPSATFDKISMDFYRRTILAAGWSAWMLRRMVAPSLVTMTSPLEVWILMENAFRKSDVQQVVDKSPFYPFPSDRARF